MRLYYYLSKELKPMFHEKPFELFPHVGLDPQRHNFMLGVPTCWYLKTLKFALPPTPTPNASRWKIGGVGSPTQNSCVGHVDFMLFVHFQLRWVAKANTISSGIWAYNSFSEITLTWCTFRATFPSHVDRDFT